MKYKSINQKKKRSLAYQNFTAFVMSGLILCLFLLSACTSTNIGNADNSKNQAIATPTVDTTLKNQADAQAQTFQQWISLMQQYGGDSTSFQQQYVTDQQALNNAHTDAEYQTALAVLNKHVEAIQLPAMKTEAQNLQQQLQQQVTTWGQTHKYYNSYDNTTYSLGYEYGANGIGGPGYDYKYR